MPKAWTCTAEPVRHGAFLQAGLDALARDFRLGEANVAIPIRGLEGSRQRDQVVARAARGEREMRRYACPKCQAEGLPGHVRAATQPEIDGLTQVREKEKV